MSKSTIKSIIIGAIVAVVLSAVFIFCYQKFFVKYSDDSELEKVQQELQTTIDKLNNVNARNDELLQLCDELEQNSKDIQNDYNYMKSNVDKIKENTQSTKELLNKVDNSADTISSTISALKENNKILRDYFNSIFDIFNSAKEEEN